MSLMTMIIKMSEGLSKTCAIFFLTLLFSLPLGMIVALLRMSKVKIVSAVTRFIITILRGTPLMLQLLAVTYGPYYLFGANVARNKLIPVVIAFSINYAADIPQDVDRGWFMFFVTLLNQIYWVSGAALVCRLVFPVDSFLIPTMIVILVALTLLRRPIERRAIERKSLRKAGANV